MLILNKRKEKRGCFGEKSRAEGEAAICEIASARVALILQPVDEPVKLLMHGSSEVVGPTFMMRLQPFDRRRMTGFAVGLSLCGGEKASVLLSLSPLSEIGRFVVAPHRRLPHRTPDRHLRAFPRKRSPSAPILRACVPLPRTLVPRLRPVGGLPAPEFSLRGTAAGPFAPVRTSGSGCARLRQIKEKQNFTKGKRSDREPFVTGRGRRKSVKNIRITA